MRPLMCPTAQRNTIGVLYPGEMGSSLAKLLTDSGFPVLTTTENRSPRTRELCREAGLHAVPTLDELLERSDILLSLVAPSAALSVAGLRSTTFRFAGFLPRSEGALRRLIEAAAASEDTLVAFESPQRLRKTLSVIADVAPDRRIAVSRELTKLHEETFVGTAAEALAQQAAQQTLDGAHQVIIENHKMIAVEEGVVQSQSAGVQVVAGQAFSGPGFRGGQ